MRTVTDQPVHARPVEIARARDRRGDETVRAHLVIDWPTWQRVRAEGLFHLDGVDSPAGFIEGAEVIVRARLRAAALSTAPDNLPAALADPTSPLSHTESWLATEAMQSVSNGTERAELGVRTDWAEPLPTSEPSGIKSLVESCLTGLGWDYERHDGDLIRFRARADGDRSWIVLIPLEPASDSGAVFSVHPRRVPVGARASIALLLLEANHQLGIGAFEIDPDDGEVRYRIPFAQPSFSDLQDILDRNLTAMSAYYDAVAQI